MVFRIISGKKVSKIVVFSQFFLILGPLPSWRFFVWQIKIIFLMISMKIRRFWVLLEVCTQKINFVSLQTNVCVCVRGVSVVRFCRILDILFSYDYWLKCNLKTFRFNFAHVHSYNSCTNILRQRFRKLLQCFHFNDCFKLQIFFYEL